MANSPIVKPSNKPLRVMFFIGEFARFAGSQRVIFTLMKYLGREGVESVAVFPGEGRCAEVFREAGLPVRVVPAPAELNVFGKELIRITPLAKAKLLLARVLPYGVKLAAVMKEEAVDVAHFSTARGLLLGFSAARRLRKPVVVHIHGAMEVLGRIVTWSAGLIPDKLVLVSESLRARVPAPFRRKCVVISNCRDAKPAPLPPSRRPDEPLTVLVASSLVPFKGYHHFLRAAARLNRERGPSAARVNFVGIGETPDPEYAAYVAGLQKELDVKNFRHEGWQSDPSVWFAAADVVVLPSVEKEKLNYGGRERTVLGNEGFGLVLLEGMALGKPVVATRVAGPPDIIDDGVDGYLVEPGDDEALARALGRLLDEPALRARMGAAAKRKAESEKFSPERAAREFAALYRALARR